MFVAPFLAPSQHAYDAVMKQAIGRSLRFGQKAKYVHVHYFVTAHTVEVNILEDRRKMILRASDEGSDGTGEVINGKEVNNGKRTETEEHPFAGPKLLVMTEEDEEIDEEQDENDDDDDDDDDDGDD
jgi:superfamily II DNA or RNA helicase